MPRNFLRVMVFGTAALLAGCDGSESTVYPADGREQNNPIDNRNADTLAGRALDGYLQDAFVWLDVNENGHWDEGEPSTETTAGGRFELDIRSLQRDASVGADLDARDYPLGLLAIPGVTLDEDDDHPVARGYLMMAPPGVNVITPFTTLIEFERRLPGALVTGTPRERVTEATRRVKARLGPDVNGFSLQVDYLQSDNIRAAAYGRAITAFLQAQTHEAWSDELAAGNRRVFDNDLINILAGLTLVQLPDLIAQASALIEADGVENFDTQKLVLPQFGLEDSDPYVIQRQRLFIDRGFTLNSDPATMTGSRAELVGFGQNENLSAELSYFYDAAGRLVRVDVRGWTDPNLEQLRALVQARGQVSLLETQLSPGLLLRYSRADELDDSIDERYVFNWAEGRIEWDTTNPEYGSAVAELDGMPEQTITWKRDDTGRVTQIARSGSSSGVAQRLELEYGGDTLTPSQYRFVGPGDLVEGTWVRENVESEAGCGVVNVFEGADTGGTADRRYYESFSTPGEHESERLMNLTRTVDYAGAAELTDVEWLYVYFDGTAGSELLDSRQPKLLQERVVKLLNNAATSCNTDERSSSTSALAVSRYDYRRLSSRLSEQTGTE